MCEECDNVCNVCHVLLPQSLFIATIFSLQSSTSIKNLPDLNGCSLYSCHCIPFRHNQYCQRLMHNGVHAYFGYDTK